MLSSSRKILRLGLSQRLVFFSVMLSVFVAGIMGVMLARFSKLIETTANLRVADDVLFFGDQIQDDLYKLFQTQEIYDQFLSEQTWKHYFEMNKKLENLFSRLKDLKGFRRQVKSLDELNESRVELERILQTATYTINPRFDIGALSPETISRIRATRNLIQKQIKEVILQERKNRADIRGILQDQMDDFKSAMAWVAVLMIIGGILYAVYLHRSVLYPLRTLIDAMNQTNTAIQPTTLEPSGAPEMRDLIESFNKMNIELARKQEKLNSMLSLAFSVAHEVRNPIAAIGTAVQVLKDNYPPNAPDREVFNEILKEVSRINAVISDLLVFSRMKPIEPEKIDLKSFFEEIRVFIQPSLNKRQIELKFQIDNCLETIWGDPDQLHRVFLNLITNSLDAISDSGTIYIRAEKIDAKNVLIAVEDSGTGISEENREKIFAPFFSTKTKGSGLGLAIVRDIVERHNGVIKLGVGKYLSGACFEIILPIIGKQND